ncbi:hypothetical protein JCM24511_02026 [Saitozyma sp. JCM 24511]|nr:hypothetical protein JCM24511_02026 [Saitozyma sp. JCM 24511]
MSSAGSPTVNIDLPTIQAELNMPSAAGAPVGGSVVRVLGGLLWNTSWKAELNSLMTGYAPKDRLSFEDNKKSHSPSRYTSPPLS